MDMTFSSWSTYKWDMWMVTTKGEYAGSWLLICFFAILFHAIKFFIFVVEDTMHPLVKEKPAAAPQATPSPYNLANYHGSTGPYGDKDIEHQSETQRLVADTEFSKNPAQLSVEKYFAFRFLHALLAGVNYALALLLMLVVMTYNPGLFMAVVVGYIIGDFLFFSRTRLHYHFQGPECH